MQHRMFARVFLPVSLRNTRAGLLGALTASEANYVLQKSWHAFGAKVLPPSQLLPPTGLGASCFQHEKHLCSLVVFPAPQAAGESYFALVIAGPSADWSTQSRDSVPVRYFILERSQTGNPKVFEWRQKDEDTAEDFEDLGLCSSADSPPIFVDYVFARVFPPKL